MPISKPVSVQLTVLPRHGGRRLRPSHVRECFAHFAQQTKTCDRCSCVVASARPILTGNRARPGKRKRELIVIATAITTPLARLRTIFDAGSNTVHPNSNRCIPIYICGYVCIFYPDLCYASPYFTQVDSSVARLHYTKFTPRSQLPRTKRCKR